jgi:hypothetical protein
MPNEFPPSGPWTGYYLYGHAAPKHPMRMALDFTPDGKIHGEGLDDVAPFTIDGVFDAATSAANWTKAYVGLHTVVYSGIYSHRSICGDWSIGHVTGGFWIWPGALGHSDQAETRVDQELPLAPELV